MDKRDIPLSDHAREIILGSLLGDGSLKRYSGYKNARFSFRHSIVQKEYFFWKVDQLKEISSTKNVFIQKNGGGYSKKSKLRFQSRALPALSKLHNLVTKKTHFKVKRKWLNQLTPLSLAVWWQDDGSIISNGRKGVFCTDGFNKKDVILLSQYFKKVLNIRTIVAPVKKHKNGKQQEYWRLWIRSTEELKKFLNIIMPHIFVESMISKITLLYKDDQLQQRWISEMVKNTIFSESTIKKCVQKKKKKWKAYRK